VTADISSRLPRIQHKEDTDAVRTVLLDSKDNDTVRHEAAELLRRSGYDTTDDLVGILEDPEEKERFRSWAVQHLYLNSKGASSEKRERIVQMQREALQDRHVGVRREALLALVRTGDPKGKETAIRWLTDEDATKVRDLAIRCVRELDLREHIPTIRKYLRDENEVVRIAAIVTLSQWGDEESRPAIEEAAKSGSFRLRRCAELALKRLDRAAQAQREIQPATRAPAAPPKRIKQEPAF